MGTRTTSTSTITRTISDTSRRNGVELLHVTIPNRQRSLRHQVASPGKPRPGE
jgi:hypothetical protein